MCKNYNKEIQKKPPSRRWIGHRRATRLSSPAGCSRARSALKHCKHLLCIHTFAFYSIVISCHHIVISRLLQAGHVRDRHWNIVTFFMHTHICFLTVLSSVVISCHHIVISRLLQAGHVRNRHWNKMDFLFFAKVQNRQHSAVLRDFAPSTWFLDVRQAEGRLDGGEGGEGWDEDEHNTGRPTHQDQDQDKVRRRIRTLVVLPIRIRCRSWTGSGPGHWMSSPSESLVWSRLISWTLFSLPLITHRTLRTEQDIDLRIAWATWPLPIAHAVTFFLKVKSDF